MMLKTLQEAAHSSGPRTIAIIITIIITIISVNCFALWRAVDGLRRELTNSFSNHGGTVLTGKVKKNRWLLVKEDRNYQTAARSLFFALFGEGERVASNVVENYGLSNKSVRFSHRNKTTTIGRPQCGS